MAGLPDRAKHLAKLLGRVAIHEGLQPTIVEGVHVSRLSESSHHRVPIIYQPRIIIVGQGRKRGYLGDKVYQYDTCNYLVLSVPLPAECEWEASPEEPGASRCVRCRADDARRDASRDERAIRSGRPDADRDLDDPDERRVK